MIQAALSCILNEYKWTTSGGPLFFSITSLKSWCWGHVINDCNDWNSHILDWLPFLADWLVCVQAGISI